MSSENNQSLENNQDKIYITDLTNKISQIIKSPNKNDFIKSYNEYHNKIKKIDDIIYKPNTIDTEIDIKVLFEMLKEYDNLIDTQDITAEEFKNMTDLIEVIENKLKTMTLETKEIQ